MDYSDRLKKNDYIVTDILARDARKIIEKYHYSGSASKTATYVHGMINKITGDVVGVTWWIPAIKKAAVATCPNNWMGVLCLSRMVIIPNVPKNACSFLLSRSTKMIDRKRWPCLVTYADEWKNHLGTIYKASNWTYAGKTKRNPTWTKDGKLISVKSDDHSRTVSQMINMGCKLEGRFSKLKFVNIQKFDS